MISPATAVPLTPRVEFPEDIGLSDLWMLFDPDWVYSAYHQRIGSGIPVPEQIRIRQVSYSPGRAAVVSYVAEWETEEYLPSQHFVAWLEREKPAEVFQFPHDPHLPGLEQASDPGGALKLTNRYALSIGARRMRVDVVRYRPGSRAVLRYSVGRAGFFAKVIRPSTLGPALWRQESPDTGLRAALSGCRKSRGRT